MDISPEEVYLTGPKSKLDLSEQIVKDFEKIQKYWNQIELRNRQVETQLTLSLVVNIVLAILAFRW